MSLVVFPFKEEDIDVVGRNLTIAASHQRVTEVWAVSAGEGRTLDAVRRLAGEISGSESTPVRAFPQQRIGEFRPGKGDGMNTAIAMAAERGFERTHFYDADITNFDESWIDGAESAADAGYGTVRHRFPRAATDAMITWMVTRPGLATLFPGTALPRLHQPLGGEMLLTRATVEALASDAFVRARSDWGIDTVITHATVCLDERIYEHLAPDGKRHALYGSLSDIRQMMTECLDAVRSLGGRSAPSATVVDGDPPRPVPPDLKETVAFDEAETASEFDSQPTAGTLEMLSRLGVPATTRVDARTWARVFPSLLRQFQLGDADWEEAAYRLWAARVLHYTGTVVRLGYDRAMSYLEATIHQFERRSGQD